MYRASRARFFPSAVVRGGWRCAPKNLTGLQDLSGFSVSA